MTDDRESTPPLSGPVPDAIGFALRMACASPAPMLVVRGDTRQVALNDACAALFKLGADRPRWSPLADLLPAAAGLVDSLLGGACASAEHAIEAGARLRVALSPLPGADGATAGLLGVAQPVPSRAGDAGHELDRLVALSPVGVVRYRLDGVIVDCNRAFLEMLGLNRADRDAGLNWRDLTPPEWRDIDDDGIVRLRERNVIPLFQKEFLHRDGHRVPVLVGAGNLEADRSQGYAIIIDISARREAERALADSEARFRVITNAMPQMVWTTLPDGYHDYYNEQWYRFTGAPPGTTDGEGWNGMFHPDDQPLAWERWRHALATGEPYEIEYRLRHHSGDYRWVLGRALPVRDAAGRIQRWMGTCTDIHEQKLTQDALREADQRKDEFLAMLGHELRNPLAPIRSAASLLPLAKNDPARIEHIGRVISRQTTHMTGLIDDLLDVSRVTRGMIELEREDVAVRHLVDEAVEQARPLIEARSHLLAITNDAEGAVVHGDRKRLVQVLSNLLSNAAKYTPAGGRISVRVAVHDAMARIAVRDNGIGMAPDLVDSAFELFRQGKRTPDRAQGGLGIGLALVRSLVQLHGGKVSAASAGEGQGSEVSVAFPLRAPLMAPTAHADAGAAPLQDSLRVLVVDDNADSAELVAMYLRMVGHVVATEFNAAAALEKARSFRPEVCFLDIGLPDLDGNELARRLRRLPGLEGTRLAAMTGYGQPLDRMSSAAAGIDAYFVKPVAMDELAAWLAQQRAA
ncbi:PAS domain S-box protein [Massilia sp. YIM B02443]|uniref:PAS domain-containing hybrid sensor histidine kinase/response regulator n=1 Tax=Massilia sp. YIM B02443 TaxID=3050127 RepID=UPI0025B64235|nr:PAS domain S-box protein [Massilia sp. YIM B02443]MDN4039178.1 PAS domain S-box protein [Massilia sp. YIM B02443]